MDERVETEIHYLENAVSKVMGHGMNLAYLMGDQRDNIEKLRQLVVALHFELEALKYSLSLGMIEIKQIS